MSRSRLRTVAPLALLVSAAAATGCATKRDVRDLQAQLATMQARQDSLFRELQRQHRESLDSVAKGLDLLVRVRGDLGHQLLSVEQQLVQLQELAGQSQRRLSDLNAQLDANRQRLTAPVDSVGSAPAAQPGGGASAQDLYDIGRSQLQNGAAVTARRAFEQLLASFPQDSLAAAAQFGIAETYALEKQSDRAIRELERVVEQYPSSARAPAALYRAGILQEERGNAKKSREYFQRVVARYPRSDEAASARRKLGSSSRH